MMPSSVTMAGDSLPKCLLNLSQVTHVRPTARPRPVRRCSSLTTSRSWSRGLPVLRRADACHRAARHRQAADRPAQADRSGDTTTHGLPGALEMGRPGRNWAAERRRRSQCRCYRRPAHRDLIPTDRGESTSCPLPPLSAGRGRGETAADPSAIGLHYPPPRTLPRSRHPTTPLRDESCPVSPECGVPTVFTTACPKCLLRCRLPDVASGMLRLRSASGGSPPSGASSEIVSVGEALGASPAPRPCRGQLAKPRATRRGRSRDLAFVAAVRRCCQGGSCVVVAPRRDTPHELDLQVG